MLKLQSLPENRELRQRSTAHHLFFHIHTAMQQFLASKAKRSSLTLPLTLIPYHVLPAFMDSKLVHAHFSKLDQDLPMYWDVQLRSSTIEFLTFVSFKCNNANLTLRISLGKSSISSFQHIPLNYRDICSEALNT